jgi:hypothetical protein
MNLRPTNHQYRSSRRAIFVNSVGATNLPPSHQVFLNRLYLDIGWALEICRASVLKIRRPKSALNLSVTDYGLKSVAWFVLVASSITILHAGVHGCKRVKVRGAECGVQIFA